MSERPVILVPRRAGQSDRDRLWTFARAELAARVPEIPVVEGHHDEGPFNRSAAINAAAAAAGDWTSALIIDADILLDATNVRQSLELAEASDALVLGYHERAHLTPKGTARILAGYRGNWRASGMVKKSLFDSCSSALAVSRKLFDAVGGFDELFVGWGWEDVAFRCAAETVSGRELVKIAGVLWHLHHVVSSGNNPNEPTFVANRERGERYRAARWNLPAIEELLAESGQARTELESLPDVTSSSSPGIPRILHRTVPAERAPEVDEWWSHALELHPGWRAMSHEDPLDPADWPETGDLWRYCRSGAQKAGLIRLEALYRWGGIYLDSDVELYRPLDPLLGLEAFAGWEDPKVVPDAVLGARPGHPAFAIMLERARASILGGGGAWASGPGVTTETLPGRPDVLLLPPGTFYPYHYTRKDEERDLDHASAQPWALGAHHWRHSWAGS
jgi:hypothetical protein